MIKFSKFCKTGISEQKKKDLKNCTNSLYQKVLYNNKYFFRKICRIKIDYKFCSKSGLQGINFVCVVSH